MVRATRGLCDFFGRPDVSDFIEDLATTTDVTALVGAGTSIESGFPDWRSLVHRLLSEVAREEGLSEEAAAGFADWTIAREGLTGAAAVATASLGPAFPACLHTALYRQQLTPPPGPSALGVTRLAEAVGWDTFQIATTNYDLVLEAAAGVVNERTPVTATGSAWKTTYRVLHLHGAMRPRGTILGDLVLSERDYFLMQEDEAWQQRYFTDRLASSTCLFVGASLTDPNLLRYLYRGSSGRTHYSIFIRQQDSSIYDSSVDEVVELRERTAEARWEQAGITPLHADYFSQSAQLLYEILHRRSTGSARRVYRPLPARLKTWRNKLDQTVLSTRRTEFTDVQDGLHEAVRGLLDGVRADLAHAGHGVRAGERLGLSMWVYDPSSETLTNWASSDRIWRDPKTLEPLPIDWTSDFVSIQAFCAGSLVSRSTERYVATRWNHVVGAPIYVEGPRLGRLPAGAVTIASTEPAPESALQRGLATLRRVSIPTIEGVLADLLDPYAVTPAP